MYLSLFLMLEMSSLKAQNINLNAVFLGLLYFVFNFHSIYELIFVN
jgi:hypothetical protein